jgi:organic hydroperoxide reductase OsmC/OhrA
VRLTTAESKGDPSILNPEQLVLMAASSCQMLWFLHLAAKARIDVVEYDDSATALMPTDREPVRITEIALRPRIVIAGEGREERVRKLVHTAHEHCFVAHSLNADMTLHPTVEVRT